jgi:eukaryotic-like serine/threonine-protein kinase
MSRRSAQSQNPPPANAAEPADSFEPLLREIAHMSPMPLALRLPVAGEVIGEKYRIDAVLGRGGMGAVFAATHRVSGKPVALKVMLQPASDAHARRRFLREARAAGRIAHPNVVDIYDVDEDGERTYLVMELLRGETLRDRLVRGRLPVREAVDVLLPAMLGVAAVHGAGVVHRDLKPENIFLCRDASGAVGEAKVLDLGISAITTWDPADPTLTQDGAVLGTPAYMSPEQLQSAREADVRTDVYAFGVILYELLTGALPFAAENHNALVLAIARGEAKDPCAMQPDLPHPLGAVVLRAIARRQEDRYATVEALIEALQPYASGGTTTSSRQVANRLASGRSGLPWSWGLAAMVVCVALALAYVGLGRPRDAGALGSSAPRPSSRTGDAAKPLPAAPTPAASTDRAAAGPEPALPAATTREASSLAGERSDGNTAARATPRRDSTRPAATGERAVPKSQNARKARSGSILPGQM